jgi:hypothetical protein
MIKRLAVVSAGLALLTALPVMAEHHEGEAAKAEVTARDDIGRATRIAVDGIEVDVCSADLVDNCINPREAGLDFGNVPLDSWPGHPASAEPEESEPAQAEESAEG